MLNIVCAHIDLPKIMNVEIRKIGFSWKIVLKGVVLKRTFLSYESALEYVPEIHNYFGDDCRMVLKEVA